MGWGEMLLQEDRKDLAFRYVRGGYFRLVLTAWVLQGSESGVVTTETVRMKVKNELKDLLEIQRGLAEMAVQLAASWTEEYRVRTAGDWRANLNADVHLQDVLKECLDFMAVMVEAGIETQLARPYVAMCIEQDKKSGVWRLDRTELDRLVVGMVKGRVEGLETPFWNKWRDGQAAEIGALLGDLERLSS
jgi:hypothetical protein